MAWARKTSSGRWQGQFRDERGRVRSYEHGTFRNEKDARDAAAEGERKVRRGEWINPELARTPFASLAHDYLEGASPFLKPKTVASYESLLRSRVLPEFGHRQVREIRPSDVVAWVGAMVGDGLSASRIRQAHVVLCLVLDAAVRDGYLMRNPAVGVKLPRLEHREAPFFEPNVVERIVDAMPPPYDLLTLLLGTLGPRWGEAAALRRQHFDALRRRLVIEESLAEISGRLVLGETKSHANRTIPLTPRLMAALSQHLESAGPNELIFTGPRGGPLRYQNFLSRVWHPVLAELGLPKVGVHVLRHSAAARLIGAGASPKAVQSILGHRSAAFTLTVYGHLLEADLDELASRLDVRERKAQ